MKRASDQFTDAQRTEIARAVANVESKSTAEIVPIVTTASGRYDRAEDLAGFILALGAFILSWIFLQREDPTAGGWGGLPLTLQLPVLVLILIAGFAVGALICAHCSWLRRLLTPAQHLTDEVAGRAGQLFFDWRIHHTDADTGILIYISLFERRATILADKGVLDAVGPETITKACDDLTTDLRTNTVPAALKSSIARLGAQLAETLPRDGEDANELSDVLITVD